MARTKITAECYGIKKEFNSRKGAMDYFLRGMMCSDGSEHQRYETIYFQLLYGRTDVSDQVDWRYL